MRGHPASRGGQWDPYSFLMRLMSMSFETPRYRVPVLVGGDHVEDIHPYEATYDPLSDVTFHGPVEYTHYSKQVTQQVAGTLPSSCRYLPALEPIASLRHPQVIPRHMHQQCSR
jgi:hypothetical protein